LRHEFIINRVSIGDELRPGRPSLDHVDATILNNCLKLRSLQRERWATTWTF
jgi:hypothetical protein